MAHAAGVDPVILAGSLCGFLGRTIPALIAWTIQRIAMRRVPHPVARWRRGGPLHEGTAVGAQARARAAAAMLVCWLVFEVTFVFRVPLPRI